MSGQPQSALTPEQQPSLWASLGLSPERGAELLKTVGERSSTCIIDAINFNFLRIVGELGRQDGLCLAHSLEQLVDSIEIPSGTVSDPVLDADEPQAGEFVDGSNCGDHAGSSVHCLGAGYKP